MIAYERQEIMKDRVNIEEWKEENFCNDSLRKA